LNNFLHFAKAKSIIQFLIAFQFALGIGATIQAVNTGIQPISLLLALGTLLVLAVLLGGYVKLREIEDSESSRQDLIQSALQVISDMSTSDRPYQSHKAVIGAILKRTSENLGVERVGYWCLENRQQNLVCHSCYVASKDQFESGAELKSQDYPNYFAALEDKSIIDAHDAKTDERTCEFAEGYLDANGITSMLDTKVSLRDKTTGIICLEHVGARREWTLGEQGFATTAADLISVAEDAYRLRSMSQQLSIEKENADASNRAKSSFLANMSHEIRTPLNGVIGMANVVKTDPSLSNKQVGRLQVIVDSGEMLLELLNDILDLSKIEAGELKLETVNFDILKIIEQSRSTWSQLARKDALNIEIETNEVFQSILLSDPIRLRQVLMNLMGNAIKFTHDGYVRLSVDQSIEDENTVRTMFEVQDTGIGIPVGQREHLFDNFKQADPSTTRKYGGSGLGLAISQRIVNELGGTIAVDSTPGIGSTFSFEMVSKMVPQEAPAIDLSMENGLAG
jgi:signal transduction histidine kinase